MIKLTLLKYRLYSDYFLPNRLEKYRSLLQFALASNYKIVSVVDYYDLRRNNKLPIDKIIICRHDIDTDATTAKDFFEIEKQLGVKASYYFRLSTLSPELMTEIEEYGSEASYHYEEIATYCKKHGIKERESVCRKMEQIQSQFIENYLSIKRKIPLKMRTVCSHGDFVNRYLKVANTELLNSDVREKCGIECETYDPIIKENTLSISDNCAPTFWQNESIFAAIKRGEKTINLLTHPRHWRVSYWENTKDNLHRVVEGLIYHYL
jgi:hypothetical protein